jgi:hypothetical protein
MPSGDLDDKIVQDMWEQSLAGITRFFMLFIPPEFNGGLGYVAHASASYGSADYSWEVLIPDEPRTVEFAFYFWKSADPTSAEVKLRFDGVYSSELSTTKGSSDPELAVISYGKTFLSTRKATTKTLELYMKKTGAGGAGHGARARSCEASRSNWRQEV